MIPSNPTLIPRPFADEGVAATIPDDKTVFGEASWREGFPTETGLPLNAGGIPPRKADFNGTLKTLSQHTFFLQSGCVYPWDATINYLANSHVVGSDGKEYAAKLPSGPDDAAGAQDPTLDTEATYWADVSKVIGTGGGEPGPTPSSAGYEICEFYNFRHPTARSGMVPRYGTLIQNAATLYPQAWAYLQTADGQLLCKTQAQWDSMHNASPWKGVGGVPFFVQDLGAGTLRVPDTRGMYAEDAGFDSLNVGDVHGPGLPNITGTVQPSANGTSADSISILQQTSSTSALLHAQESGNAKNLAAYNLTSPIGIKLDASRSNKIYGASSTVRPRSFGVLPCVYLGA